MSAPGNKRKADVSREDWETPPTFFRWAEALHGPFTLDAAASADNTKCLRWLSGPCLQSEDCGCGLCASWERKFVWLNPPYGRGMDQWVRKCIQEATAGSVVTALLPNATDTQWFEDCWQTAASIRFLVPRISFIGTQTGNTVGSILAHWQTPGTVIGAPMTFCTNWKKAVTA